MATITVIQAVQVLSISSTLLGAGSIATMSIFDVPEIRSQPADRALPMIRWLFSRGSHIFPPLAILSSTGFGYLAYHSLTKITLKNIASNGYIAAAVLAFSIAPFTANVMIPNNFAIIEKNEKLGGTRSVNSAKDNKTTGMTAEDSVNSKGMPSQWTDLSDPQTRTESSSTAADDKEVHRMLGKFQTQNMVRALLMGAGGVVGLLTALA